MGAFMKFFNTSQQPVTDNAYDLGATSFRFKDLYLAGNFIGGSTQIGGQNFARSGIMAVSTADATVANTTTETTLVGTLSGTATLSANSLAAGRMIRVTAAGYLSSLGVVSLRVRFRYAGISGTVLMDTTADKIRINATTRLWGLVGIITCRSTGASGTVYSQGIFRGPVDVDMQNTTTTTVDTTASALLVLSAEWGTGVTASDTITCTNLLLEVLN